MMLNRATIEEIDISVEHSRPMLYITHFKHNTYTGYEPLMILVRKESAVDSCLISRNSQPLDFRPIVSLHHDVASNVFTLQMFDRCTDAACSGY